MFNTVSRWFRSLPTQPWPGYSDISIRLLVLVAIISLLGSFALASAIWPDLLDLPAGSLPDAAVGIFVYLIYAAIVLWICQKRGLTEILTLGRWPLWRDGWVYAAGGVILVCVSGLLIYAVFLPLSYAAPEFVRWWVLDTPELIRWESDTATILANGINLLMLVVIAPICEEILFRGFILHRLSARWGMRAGIILSSLFFGLLHVDFLGGIVFAVILALIALKTGSLVGPIIVHMANNAVVALVYVAEGLVSGGVTPATLEQFRSEWWLMPIFAVIGLPGLVWFLGRLFRPGVRP